MENPFDLINKRLDNIESILSEIKNSISGIVIPEKEEYLTIKEAIKELKISNVTLYKWMKEGKIPYHRIGSRVRFKRSELFDLETAREKRRAKRT